MSLKVTITVTGSDRVRRKMVRLGSSLYNFKDAMTEIGRQGKEYFAGTAWNSQGGVFGNKWAALSEPYVRRKAAKYRSNQILVATGAMRQGFRMYADKNSVFIDNRAPQFKYHQSSRPRTKMPRRQMIGISTGFKAIVRDVMEKDIRKKIADS